VLCGAMILAALRDGASQKKIAAALRVPLARFGHLYDRLKSQGVFTARGLVRLGASSDSPPDELAIAYILSVTVGLCWLDRVSP